MSPLKPLNVLLPFCVLALLAGCATQSGTNTLPQAAGISGSIHGGQQPVAFSTIQLYTVGTTGDGSSASPLLTQTVTSDAGGNFTLTNLYSCTGATQVYLTATGGQVAPGVTNPNLSMMAALGQCSSLGPSTFISLNEVTTVAAVSSLTPYMTGYSAVGSNSSDVAALNTAFALAAELANTASGQSPGNNVPAGMAVPSTLINTLANVVAACINSPGGVANDGSPCGKLFALTKPSGSPAPTDTIGALLYLARNPVLNTPALFNLITPAAPFQPQAATPPPDFHVQLVPATSASYVLQVGPSALTFPGTLVGSPSGAQSVQLLNQGTSSISLAGFGITGTNAGDFGATSTCGPNLAPNAGCSVQVTATPSAVGSRTAYLSVASSSPNSPQYVQLSATGISSTGPSALLSAIVLATSITGASYDVGVSSIGTSPLVVSNVAASTQHTATSSTCTSSVAPGGSCSVAITDLVPFPYSPTAPILPQPNSVQPNSYDQIAVTTNDPSGPSVIAITETAAQAVAPSNVLYAPVVVGSSATSVVDFVSGPTSTAITIGGSNPGDFSAPAACVPNYAGSYTCGIAVVFTPTAAGLRTAKLYLGGTAYVPLVGTGVGSIPSSTVTLSSSSLNFVDLSGPQTVTLTNNSLSIVNIQSIATTSGFTQTNLCGNLLAVNSSCTITVTSTRTVGGGDQGLLTVTDDAGTQNASLASSVGIIIPFGSTTVGATSPVTWSQKGTGAAIYDQVIGTLSGANPGDFTTGSCYIQTNGGNCSITEGFKPTASGPRLASLTINYPPNAGISAYNIKYLLQGTGAPGTQFALFPAGSDGFNNFVSAWNTGSNPIYLNNPGAVITGPNASEFQFATTNIRSGSPYSYVENLTYNFIGPTPDFSPFGLRTANLVVTDSQTLQSVSYPLEGIAQFAGPAVSPTVLSFPLTPLNTFSQPMSFTVKPRQHAAITAGVSYNPINFILTKSSCAAMEVPCILTAIFQPTNSYPVIGYVSVSDTSTVGVSSIQLRGTGQTQGAAYLNFYFYQDAPPNFAHANSPPIGVTMTNTGTVSASIASIAMGGTNAPEFSVSSNCGSSLAPSASCTVTVSFVPLFNGYKNASVVVTDPNGTVIGGFAVTAAAP